jgi:uncharacterized protein YkwD
MRKIIATTAIALAAALVPSGARGDVPSGWAGDPTSCDLGAASAAYRDAVTARVNQIRRIAGLSPVRQLARLNGPAHAAAVMMEANGTASHVPPTTWRCWTPTGARAARISNLIFCGVDRCPDGQLYAERAVDMYVDDPDWGELNDAAGHRRLILEPDAGAIGIGATARANALTVEQGYRGRRNPRFVPWPAAGAFPASLEPDGRWSLSVRRGIRLERARVAVWHNGVRLPVVQYPLRPSKVYAPALVWAMPEGFAKRGAYRVVVRGIRDHGAHRYVYTVRLR